MSVLSRIYSDYFLPNRLGVYEDLICESLSAGYEHLTIPQFYELALKNSIPSNKKYFIHRHDIDTDAATAREMFCIEKKSGIKSSWYFRLNTMDPQLMNEIRNYGSEVGYHFEELSDVCKTKKIRSASEAEKHYTEMRGLFRSNLLSLEKKCGFRIRTIASHGDFVNRAIGLSNFAFITKELMHELGIDFECYDELLLKNYGTILSDMGYPDYYRPTSPFDAIKNNHPKIYLLSHPRHWRKDVFLNTTDNITRLIQGLKYKL